MDHTAENRPRLLIVDDDPEMCRFIRMIGTRLGFDVVELSRPAEFVARIKEFSPTLITLDLQMPDADGVMLLRQLARAECNARIIFVSGCDERILQTVQELAQAHGLVTAGVVRKPVSADRLEQLIREAGITPAEVRDSDLREALRDGQFVVHYQPQIERRDDRWILHAAEALLRWRHPIFGVVKPSTFLPVAEKSGQIGPITDFVFRQAVDQIRVWRKAGLELPVAVNLAPVLVDDLELPDRLHALLSAHGLQGSSLTAEITESSLLADSTKAMDILARLRVMGIGLSIDDFGTGSSSLRQLYRMPFNELKIDGSFVREVTTSEEARVIVRATVQMAHALKMKTCAEWVSSADILAFLEEIGCDRAQGHLIGPAVEGSQFLQAVANWRGRQPGLRKTATQ